MGLAVYFDLPETYIPKARYTAENLFFPLSQEIRFINVWDEFVKYPQKILYCTENSSYLKGRNRYKNILIIILQNKTIDYFSNFMNYPLENIKQINKFPCLFPLHKQYAYSSDENILHFDLFAASFFFLSCWQEYVIKERDGKGRIPYNQTIQYKTSIGRKAIVNEYLFIFKEKAEKVWNQPIDFIDMPGGGKTSVVLSHDIDAVDWSFSKYMKHQIGNRRKIDITFLNLLATVKNYWAKKKIFDTVKKIELNAGAASTLFFLSNYPESHKAFAQSLVKSMRGTAFEVGHHISEESIFNRYLKKDREAFLSANSTLIFGARVHALRFEINSLFSELEKNGYYYDNSLLFAEEMGYRTGFTYPNYIFDPYKNRPFSVLSIPLNVMDNTLFDLKYLGLSSRNYEKTLYSFTDKALDYGGVLSVLFHHNSFWINTYSRVNIFRNFLNHISGKGLRMTTCCDIYIWYKSSSQKKLSKTDN